MYVRGYEGECRFFLGGGSYLCVVLCVLSFALSGVLVFVISQLENHCAVLCGGLLAILFFGVLH